MFKPIQFVYGGTFDPPHYGHLRPLQSTADLLGIPEIELMPAFIPAFKTNITASHHRLNMTQLLEKEDHRFRINTIEIERNSPTYTIDTVKALKQAAPERKIVFIVGMDSLTNIHKWLEWKSLFTYCHLLVMQRPNDEYQYEKTKVNNKLASKLYKFRTEQCLLDDIVNSEMDAQSKLYLSSKLAPVNLVKQCDNHTAFMDIIGKLTEGNLWLVKNQPLHLSSTRIREMVQANEDVSSFMPESIIEYIKQHKLYQQ